MTGVQTCALSDLGLSLYLSPWWQRDLPQLDDSGAPPLRVLATLTTGVILVQLILGAAFRHGAFGIDPHLFGAGFVTAFVVWTGVAAKRRFRAVRELRRATILLHSFFGIQILLGLAAWWAVVAAREAVQPTFVYVTLTVAHVLGGALTLAASVLLTLICFRLIRPAVSVAAQSRSAYSASETSAERAEV